MNDKLEDRIIMLFDVDGVVAETPHEEAWQDAALELGIIGQDFDFTNFYAAHVAGEPGVTGALKIMELIPDENGMTYFERDNISDRENKIERAEWFRNLKQAYLDGYLSRGEFRVFRDVSKIYFGAKEAGVPVGVVSSSENARAILQKIDAVRLAEEIGVNYTPAGEDISLYGVFDTRTLGAKTFWHGTIIEKSDHYVLAKGMLLEKADANKGVIPYTIVFEDAPQGISQISNKDFYCIGISRKSTSGKILASKESLIGADAKLCYDESELEIMDYQKLRAELLRILPSDIM